MCIDALVYTYGMSPEEFVILVVSAYKNGGGIFVNKINAEDLVPTEFDDLKKALFFFYVLQLDYAMKSQILYSGGKKLPHARLHQGT